MVNECRQLGQTASLDHVAVEEGAPLQSALERGKVDVDDSKTFGEAVTPFEIVEQ